MRRTALVAAALLAAAAAPGEASAQQNRGAAAAPDAGARPPETLSRADAREALRATDPERVVLAIDTIAASPTVDGVNGIIELLRSGPSDRITDHAVEALGTAELPAAIEELSNLLHHRRPTVRQLAVGALAHIRDDRVRPLIEGALHDSNPAVRGAAATALGEIGARQSVTLLFRAFERGVPEAAASIGRLAEPSAAVSASAEHDAEDPRTTSRQRTLAMWIGRMPLSQLLPGFNAFLRRRDIPRTAKVQIIARLEQIATAEVRGFLERWVASLPASYRGEDRDRATTAISRIQGGSR